MKACNVKKCLRLSAPNPRSRSDTSHIVTDYKSKFQHSFSGLNFTNSSQDSSYVPIPHAGTLNHPFHSNGRHEALSWLASLFQFLILVDIEGGLLPQWRFDLTLGSYYDGFA